MFHIYHKKQMRHMERLVRKIINSCVQQKTCMIFFFFLPASVFSMNLDSTRIAKELSQKFNKIRSGAVTFELTTKSFFKSFIVKTQCRLNYTNFNNDTGKTIIWIDNRNDPSNKFEAFFYNDTLYQTYDGTKK